MKISVATLGLLGALASSVGAIEIDVEDSGSIKKAAAIVAKGLRKWYTGDQPGDTPGNLPDPYYWWECGAMFGGYVDYWYYTGDDTYNAITKQAMIHQIGSFDAFEPENQTKTLGNDDQAFWGMAALSAAENKFPEPSKDEAPSWLSLAQAVFNRQAARWNDEACGGGLKWQIFTFNKGYNYRNTISNGCFFNIAARLAKYTGNETYSYWAQRTWDWELSLGLMSKDYHFYDGTDDRNNCSTINHIQWTYNAGVHMAGAAAMWNLTKELENNSTDTTKTVNGTRQSSSSEWEARLTTLIKSTDVFFKNDIMYEVACESNGKCNYDQRSFKAYLARWMGYSMQVAPFTRDLILPRMKTSAEAAAKQCNAGEDQTTCGLKWTENGANDGSFGPGEQMAAMEIMTNLLIDEVSGPLTLETGGISKSNPSAGGNGVEVGSTPDEITTGDRAGAGILTTVVLVGILGGAWWMVS